MHQHAGRKDIFTYTLCGAYLSSLPPAEIWEQERGYGCMLSYEEGRHSGSPTWRNQRMNRFVTGTAPIHAYFPFGAIIETGGGRAMNRVNKNE